MTLKKALSAMFVGAVLLALHTITGPHPAAVAFQDQSKPQLNEIIVGSKSYLSLQEAFKAVQDGGVIYIGPGIYKQGAALDADNVTIVGSDGTHFMDTIVGGKATFVIRGKNTTMRNIECSGAKAGDRNGACIRFEGYNLTLNNVYFHDSQSGLLASNGDRGLIDLKYVRMERLGKAGRAHAVYVNGGKFRMRYSIILSSKDQAHAIKSRALETTLIGNVIASLDGDDSRLVDIPNGGKVLLKDNLFVEGPKTVNYQILSWGVEGPRDYPEHSFIMQNNMVVSDRARGSVLLGLHKTAILPTPVIGSNVFIGRYQGKLPDGNRVARTRAEFGFPEHPDLPFWPGAIRALKMNREFEENRRKELMGY